MAGDVDGDGHDDLVTGVGSRVSLYLGPVPAAHWTTGAPIVTGLALLDVDADGVKEIAVLNGDLTILRFAGGALTPIGGLALGASGGELRNATVDDQRDPDLLAWDATRVWMIPMQGAAPQAPTTFLHGCGDPRGAAGDIDNDGDEDVVVFDMGTYRVFRRTSPTTYVPGRSDHHSRQILNFGHTIAHALETVTSYQRFRHGEAVGHGMLIAGELSKNLGLLDQTELELLNKAVSLCGPLPSARDLDERAVVSAIAQDKKRTAGQVQWVLLERIGRPRIVDGKEISPTLLRKSVRDVFRRQ